MKKVTILSIIFFMGTLPTFACIDLSGTFTCKTSESGFEEGKEEYRLRVDTINNKSRYSLTIVDFEDGNVTKFNLKNENKDAWGKCNENSYDLSWGTNHMNGGDATSLKIRVHTPGYFTATSFDKKDAPIIEYRCLRTSI